MLKNNKTALTVIYVYRSNDTQVSKNCVLCDAVVFSILKSANTN